MRRGRIDAPDLDGTSRTPRLTKEEQASPGLRAAFFIFDCIVSCNWITPGRVWGTLRDPTFASADGNGRFRWPERGDA